MSQLDSRRLDPSMVSKEDLVELGKVFARPEAVVLLDVRGRRTPLPSALAACFGHVVRLVSEGKTVVLVPEDAAITTQAAANYLGVSRQYLVNLLEKDEIPHHRVGAHRRVRFRDLLEYERRRNDRRRDGGDDTGGE